MYFFKIIKKQISMKKILLFSTMIMLLGIFNAQSQLKKPIKLPKIEPTQSSCYEITLSPSNPSSRISIGGNWEFYNVIPGNPYSAPTVPGVDVIINTKQSLTYYLVDETIHEENTYDGSIPIINRTSGEIISVPFIIKIKF